MKFLDRLPPREIEGADEVFEGAVIQTDSGNVCRFWPAVTYDSVTDESRIVFYTEWRLKPTPDDAGEFIAWSDGMMGKSAEVALEGSPDRMKARTSEWLTTGKTTPERTN